MNCAVTIVFFLKPCDPDGQECKNCSDKIYFNCWRLFARLPKQTVEAAEAEDFFLCDACADAVDWPKVKE